MGFWAANGRIFLHEPLSQAHEEEKDHAGFTDTALKRTYMVSMHVQVVVLHGFQGGGDGPTNPKRRVQGPSVD